MRAHQGSGPTLGNHEFFFDSPFKKERGQVTTKRPESKQVEMERSQPFPTLEPGGTFIFSLCPILDWAINYCNIKLTYAELEGSIDRHRPSEKLNCRVVHFSTELQLSRKIWQFILKKKKKSDSSLKSLSKFQSGKWIKETREELPWQTSG